jgi:hypothetical protein
MLIQFLLIATLVIAFVILLPDMASVIARIVGIGRGVDLVIYAAITLLFVMVFKVFLTLDRLEQKLTDMVRKDALSGVAGSGSAGKDNE